MKPFYITKEKANGYKAIRIDGRLKIAEQLNTTEETVRMVLSGKFRVTQAGLQILKLADSQLSDS